MYTNEPFILDLPNRVGAFPPVGLREEVGVGRLISKVPMAKMVVDENNILWEYTFYSKGGPPLFKRVATVVGNDLCVEES